MLFATKNVLLSLSGPIMSDNLKVIYRVVRREEGT